MINCKRSAPQIPVVLASLILWVSFAWGLPADTAVAEAEADVAAEDRWAGVRISDAYDYAKCPECGEKNEIRRPACYRCGYTLPQPSGEYTYPPWVFVPGKGYYQEETVVEPAKTRKCLWVTGLVLSASAIGTFIIIKVGEASHWWEQIPDIAYAPLGSALVVMTLVGAGLLIAGLTTCTEPVYAFESGERYEPYEPPAFALRSPDPDDAALKIEVTLLGF